MQLIPFGRSSEEASDVAADDGDWSAGYLSPPGEQGCEYRVSTQFVVIDGRVMHMWAEFESKVDKDDAGRPKWFARVELDFACVPRIVNIGFVSSPTHQREPKGPDFDRLRRTVFLYYSAFCAELGPDGEPVFRLGRDADKPIAEFIEQRRTGRRRLKTEDYKRAARVYKDNFDGTPARAVAEAFGVGQSRANQIIAECRRRKFLGPTKQGRKSL